MRRPHFALLLLVGILATPTAALAQSSCSEIQIGSSYTSYSCYGPFGGVRVREPEAHRQQLNHGQLHGDQFVR